MIKVAGTPEALIPSTWSFIKAIDVYKRQGKYRIVHRIREQLPPGHRLVEPFVGSGAVFLNLDYPGYLLCDNNADLINLFQVLKEEGETFVKYCRDYFTPASNREEEYYRFRSEFNRTGNKKQKAARCV